MGGDVGGSDEYAASSSNNLSAYNPGIYFGAQFGASNTHYTSSYSIPTNDFDKGYHFSFRLHAGYAFSEFIALESGYTYYGQPKFIEKKTTVTQHFLQQGVDLMAKASLPLDYGFGLYAKGGLAWIFRGALHSKGGLFGDRSSNNKITPVGSIGINYWFTSNMALDFGFTKTMKAGSLPTIDFFALGIIYKINV